MSPWIDVDDVMPRAAPRPFVRTARVTGFEVEAHEGRLTARIEVKRTSERTSPVDVTDLPLEVREALLLWLTTGGPSE